jgi:uncharacterized protein YbjT (DUF2867 family)
MGASVRSGIFYNRVKGKAEEAVRNSGIASVTIVRPSFIVGERNESRAGESTALTLMRVFAPVTPRKYRPIAAQAVALALLEGARAARPGVTIVESDRLQDLVR